ncbi:MAG: hypothetical protein EP338_05790 [Bacteroidetes bacterium]|nr:MAG: hypothetical protein EP338_05790 [Bacteroidota bacterium]
MKRLLITLFASVGLIFSLGAQKDFALYNLQGTPQAVYANPAFVPKTKIYVSIPGLSFTNLGVSNSAFSFNDLVTQRPDDSLEWNTTSLFSKLKDLNVFSLNMQNEIFGFGFKLHESYFNFSMMHQTKFDLLYPGDLFKLAFKGNAEFLGQRASMNGIGVNLSSYMTYNFGFARRLGDTFHVGGRLKIASGIANFRTKKTVLGLYTDPVTYALTVDGGMQVNSSNIAVFTDSTSNADPSILQKSAYNFANKGVGLDLGGTFQMNEKVVLSASALNLGTISWTQNTRSYEVKDFNFSFDGVDLNGYFVDSSGTDVSQMADDFIDTLTQLFNEEGVEESYVTGMGSRFYVGATYELTPSFNVGATVFSEVLNRQFVPGLTIAANARVKDWLFATVNYTMYNGSFANLGVGLSLRGGPIQFFIMSDNVLAFVNPYGAKSAHLCTGLAIAISEKSKKEKKKSKDVIE